MSCDTFKLEKKNHINSLFSGFYKKPKIFTSIFNCKKSKDIESSRDDQIFIDSYGLLITYHKEKREKVKIEKIKPKRLYYDYFEEHNNCKETEFYWKDPKHPKILRHLSENKKIKPKK